MICHETDFFSLVYDKILCLLRTRLLDVLILFGLLCPQWKFESRKRTRPWALSVDQVCVSTNAADSCDKRVHSVTSEKKNLFFFLPLCSIGTSEQHGSMRPEELAKIEAKKVFMLHRYWHNDRTKPANGNIYTFFSLYLQTNLLLCLVSPLMNVVV